MEEELELELLSDEELAESFVGDAFTMYMREVFSYAPLSIEENKELSRAYKSGDIKAKEKMINGNLRLVVNVAYKYRSRITHLQILDVIQEGNVGLMRAIEDYDPEVGAFSTYAMWWIKQAISRSISDKESEIRKPVHIQERLAKYYKLLEQNKGKQLSDKELCKLLDVTQEVLDNIKHSASLNTFSMNQTTGDDEDTELGAFLSSPNDSYADVDEKLANRNLFLVMKEFLNDSEYFVLYYRILDNPQKTLEEIGEMLGITRERVRQVEAKVLRKVKPLMTNENRMLAITNKISEREGRMVDVLRTEPVDPNKIIKYMYVKDSLTLKEKKLLYLMYFGKYNLSRVMTAKEMNISLEECNLVYESLMNKIKEKLANKSKYESYRGSLIKNYGTKIFSVDLKSDLKVIDYDDLHTKYADLSYDEIMELFSRSGYTLTHDEHELIERFYKIPVRSHKMYEEMFLADINLSFFGYKERSTDVPKHKLYEVYLRIKDELNKEQRLFLECYYFNKRDKSEFKTSYKDSSLIYRYHYLIDRLERTYYNIYRFFDNNFGKDEYLEFKEKFGSKLTPFRIELLDLAYGVNGKPLSISEMATMYNMDYIKMHDLIREARDAAIIFYTGRRQKIDIDKNIYIPYVKDYSYEFVPETREVLSFFLIDDMDYGEIAEEMGLTRYRVSNIITEGIRKIDNYRFGVSEAFKISKKELEDVFEYFDSFSEEEQTVLEYKFIYHMDNSIIGEELGIDKDEVNRYVAHFNKLYYSYRIKNVVINEGDILAEVNRHISDSVLDTREKEVASLYYGFKNKFNSEGKRYTADEIKEKLHLTKNAYYRLFQNVICGVKGRKIGIKQPDYMFIDRDKMDKLLDDIHLPISNKEREIICYLFELKGYPFMRMTELPDVLGDTRASITRRYQRAIVSIFKYLNKEIEGSINYEVDILPNLKYFSYSDRIIIDKYFVQGISVEALATEYNVGFEKMGGIVRRIKTTIFDLLNNPKTKKFDYDYYMKVRYEDDLPFYGELDKTIEIFDLFHGMNDGLRMSVPEIIKKLDLGLNESSVNKGANYLMLSICKYQDGIRKGHTFSYEEIKRYYELHSEEMTYYHKQFYLRYFEKYENPRRLTGVVPGVNYTILNDLLKSTRSDYITLESLNREKAIQLIKKYKMLSGSTKKELMYMFDLTGREFMNGKDVNHVYRLLYTLDSLLLERGNVLKKD